MNPEDITVPVQLWLDESLGAIDKAIIIEIHRLGGSSTMSDRQLADFLMCDESMVARSIDNLSSDGFMRVTTDGQRTLTVSPDPWSKPEDDEDQIVSEVIGLLNEMTGQNLRPTSKSHRRFVLARIHDGYSVDDLKSVVVKKCNEWMGSGMSRYLRPKTLFCEGNFDSYLNQPDPTKVIGGGSDDGWDQPW